MLSFDIVTHATIITFFKGYSNSSHQLINTVPIFYSCTKCVGSPGIMHDRMPDCHPASWAWMTSQLNVALICKLPGSLMCLAYFFVVHVIHRLLYNLILADVWLTGAVIECMYCIYTKFNQQLVCNNFEDISQTKNYGEKSSKTILTTIYITPRKIMTTYNKIVWGQFNTD